MKFWPENSILTTYNETTKPIEIFKEVCDLIGNYYVEKGWKYFKSRPKIKYESEDLVCEICFWSSHSNMAGSYVSLETLIYVNSKKLKNWINENNLGRNYLIFAPRKYSFRNINVYGINEMKFEQLLDEIDDFIKKNLNIEDNEQFIENCYNELNNVVIDNFACYAAMMNDKRLKYILDYDNGFQIDEFTFKSLKKYCT